MLVSPTPPFYATSTFGGLKGIVAEILGYCLSQLRLNHYSQSLATYCNYPDKLMPIPAIPPDENFSPLERAYGHIYSEPLHLD